MDWFLYDRDLNHERGEGSTQNRKKKHANERFTELEKNLFLLELTIAPQEQD